MALLACLETLLMLGSAQLPRVSIKRANTGLVWWAHLRSKRKIRTGISSSLQTTLIMVKDSPNTKDGKQTLKKKRCR